MGLFDRIRNAFRSKPTEREQAAAIVHTTIDEALDEPELEVIWEELADDMGALESVDSADEFRAFTMDGNGMELFEIGWMDESLDSDTRAAAREEFFELMEAYDISRDNFDWDAWRDWYEA